MIIGDLPVQPPFPHLSGPTCNQSALQQESAPEIKGNLKTKVTVGPVVSGLNIFALSRPKIDFSPETQGLAMCLASCESALNLKSKSVDISSL